MKMFDVQLGNATGAEIVFNMAGFVTNRALYIVDGCDIIRIDDDRISCQNCESIIRKTVDEFVKLQGEVNGSYGDETILAVYRGRDDIREHVSIQVF